MFKDKKKKIDIWAESGAIDLWTLVHFLSGVLLGFVPFFINLTVGQVFMGAVILLILWEAFEYVINIQEARGNRIVDVLVAVLGFNLVIWVFPSLPFLSVNLIFFALLLSYVIMNFMGWVAYKKRTGRK